MADFDWVVARGECSPESAFERLKLQVEQDIAARKAQRLQGAVYGFNLISEGDAFTVRLEGNNVLKKSVTFRQSNVGVDVFDATGRVMLNAVLTLNDQGECRFKVNGKEKDFWQIRHAALEDLFFGDLFRPTQT